MQGLIAKRSGPRFLEDRPVPSDRIPQRGFFDRGNLLALAGASLAWTWTVVAGGGGLMLLIEEGPWPLTNGWFAMFSGIAACPVLVPLARRVAHIELTGRVRFWAALAFLVAGRIALLLNI